MKMKRKKENKEVIRRMKLVTGNSEKGRKKLGFK